MNEDEFASLGAAGDPWALAAGALGPDLKLIAVTLGERGAAYVTGADFVPDPMRWHASGPLAVATSARSGKVSAGGEPRVGDPTGCGDVWGATLFARMLRGDTLEVAMAEANRLASLNVEHRGARGLDRHLRGRLSHLEPSS
jgi:sugar/nucleoside kinase (ribokinase family)